MSHSELAPLLAEGDRLLAARQPAPALEAFRAAAALAADAAEAWAGQGIALQALGRRVEAEAALRRALALGPKLASARNALGTLLLAERRLAEAAEEFAAAAAAAPGWWAPAANLALAAQRQGRAAAALAAADRATALAPHQPAAWHILGTVLQQLHRPAEAEAAYRRGLALAPGDAAAHGNLGRALRDQGRLAAAAECYDRALALRPDHAETRWNRAILDFLRGDWAAGWEGAEWRWHVPGFPSPRRGFRQPLWLGEVAAGRTLLLHAEQGFGDSLMMLRFVATAAARVGRVVLELPGPLLRLARASALPAELVEAGAPLPGFDLHCPLMSLPRACRARPGNVPVAPWLRPPAEVAAEWARRLPADGGPPRVGLVWAGSPTHGNDSNRSLPPAVAAALAALPCIRPVSLQKGARAGELAVPDLAPLLGDFAATAAALARLDLLVSVDTAVVHLAGAMGLPCRVLLPHAADWRWGAGGATTPWYPGHRLLRQAAPGDWSAPLAALAAELTTPALVQAA